MPKIVTFGEVMMRLTTPSFQKIEQAESFEITFAGSEMNVSASLINLGFEAEHVTIYPDNSLGLKALNFQKKMGFVNQHVPLEGSRIGTFYHEKGVAMRSGKNVYDRENSAFANQKPNTFDWEEILKGADWFHWSGITPALSSAAASSCLEAVRMAKQLGLTVSSDIYYRSNLWNYGKTPEEILPEIASYSDVLVANTENIQTFFGIKENDFESVCRALFKKHPQIKKVVTTIRTQNSATHNILQGVLCNHDSLFTTEEIEINPIVDRLGGGDAFLAGFIYGQMHFKDEFQALNFGLSASALKHSIPGDQNLASVEDILEVMNGNTSGSIKR